MRDKDPDRKATLGWLRLKSVLLRPFLPLKALLNDAPTIKSHPDLYSVRILCPLSYATVFSLQELLSLAKRKRVDSGEQEEPVNKPAASTDSETSDSDDEVRLKMWPG